MNFTMNDKNNINAVFSQFSSEANEVFWYTTNENGIQFYQDEIFKNGNVESDKTRIRFENAVRMSLDKHKSNNTKSSSDKSIITVSVAIENQIFHYKTVIFKNDGEKFISGITTDTTMEINSAKTLAKNETVYRTLLKTIPDAIVLVDPDGDIVKANDKMAAFTNQAREDMIGEKFTSFIAVAERGQINKLIEALKPGEAINEHEFTFIRNDKSEFSAELTATLISNTILNIRLYIVVIRDITVRKEAQLKSEKTQRELLNLFFNRLSNRELELLGYIKNGKKWPSEKRLIAKTMYVLPGTLDKFMTRIKAKLHTSDVQKIIKIYSQFTEN